MSIELVPYLLSATCIFQRRLVVAAYRAPMESAWSNANENVPEEVWDQATDETTRKTERIIDPVGVTIRDALRERYEE